MTDFCLNKISSVMARWLFLKCPCKLGVYIILQIILITCIFISNLTKTIIINIALCIVIFLINNVCKSWHLKALNAILFISITSNFFNFTPLSITIPQPYFVAEASNVGPSRSSYKLIGSSSSFAQYLPWYPCLDGTLVFEFKTHEPNGLLLYTQALPYKYIQLSLVDGSLRMRMRIGEKDNPRGVFLVYKASKLNDEKWHEVKITRQNEQTLLTIDNKESLYHVHKDASLEGYDLYFGSQSNDLNVIKTDNLLLIGGLPNYIQTYDLSLGTALFEHRFNGFIRNVRALNCSAPNIINLFPTASNNLRYISEGDACISNPCQNNGVCLLETSNKYRCDCSYTDYEGTNCEKLKSPKKSQVVTMSGKEYLSFEVPPGQDTVTSFEEEFSIDFKTSRSVGLLAYAGNSEDYIVIGIQDGGLYFKLNIKGETLEKTLIIPGTVLNNNQWHSIKFSRKVKQIDILIDNIKRDLSEFKGDFISMKTRVIYIGGAPKQNTIYRTIRKNFIGCLRSVTFKRHNTMLNLIDMAIDKNKQITFEGQLKNSCEKVTDPITLSSPESYIPVSNWHQYPRINTFSIEFQTTESFGVLAYILGNNNQKDYNIHYRQSQSPLLSFNRDFFSLEIHNRLLNAYFNFGSNYTRYEVIHEDVSNGKPHQLSIEINQKFVVFKFDQKNEKILMFEEKESLDLNGPLIIGGIHPQHRKSGIPPYFFAGMLGHGFVGCIQDLEMNGQFVNLTKFAAIEGVSGVSAGMCLPMPNQCEIGHCMNNGVCVEGWNRFVCDCSATGFNGPICNQPATISNFKNSQYISIKFEPEWISEAEHISLRFRTNQRDKCILLSTFTPFSNDLMEISLENSQIKLYLKIGDSETILYSKEGMNDNQWHTIKILREGLRIIFQVDINEPSTGMLTESDAKKGMFLIFTYLEIGTSVYSRHLNSRKPFLDGTKQNSLAYEKLNLGNRLLKESGDEYFQRSMNSFEGQMQQLVINGKSYFELIDNGNLDGTVTKTVTFVRNDLPHKYPLTFHDTGSWLTLPKIDAFHMLMVQFHFKTSEPNGLILYNGGQNNDYFAVELHNGQIYYHFSLGNVNNVVQSKSKFKLNDNKWHLVSIWRSTKTNHELSVDSLVYKYSSKNNQHTVFNLAGNLYVGGLSDVLDYQAVASKSKISSRYGFKGCLASLEINGRVPDINDIVRGEGMHGRISQGCESISSGCQKNTCKNDGICIDKWEENKQICNCQMTTFVGDNCESVSLGFLFDRSEMQFVYNTPLYSEDIRIVFGFETKSADALLFKSKSERTRKNVIIEIKNGFIQAAFSDGYGVSTFHKFAKYQVNNEKYHIVKLLVMDNNSTLLVDKRSSEKKIISEKSLNFQPILHSNSDKIEVQIGGSSGTGLDIENKQHHILHNIPLQELKTTQEYYDNHLLDHTRKTTDTLTTVPVARDHLYKILQTVTESDADGPSHLLNEINKEDEATTTNMEMSRDHLLYSLDSVVDMNNESKFVGKIFGLVFNEFRILDLAAKEDSRIKINGIAILLENSVINQVNDESIGCDEKNLRNCGYTDSDKHHIKKIKSYTQPNSDYYDYTLTNFQFETETFDNKNEEDRMSSNSNSAATSPTDTVIVTTEEPFSSLFQYSSSLTSGLIIALALTACILIVALCKYRNRDEGTYTIDESKNCGPFAELDMPLNGSSKKMNKKATKNNRRTEISNKEWYV